VQKVAEGSTSLRLLALNVALICLWFPVFRSVFHRSLDSAVGWLSLVITIEALLVTTVVLNHQGREAKSQKKRTERQFKNTETTVKAVQVVQEQLRELRGDRMDAGSTAVATTAASTVPLPPAPQVSTTGNEEHKP
jgi:uncharacterized membrane protein